MDLGYRPHPVLKRYYSDDIGRQRYVRRAFDLSAHYYDRINRVLSLGTDRWYRRKAIARAGLTSGMRVLDVGCGTGLAAHYAADRVGPGGCVVGLDPSIGMLREAMDKGRVTRPVLGRGEALPFADDSFDVVTMSYALRHVSDLSVAFTEYRRVLKPGGRVLLLELTLPETGVGRAGFRLWMKHLVPALTRVSTGSRMAQELYAYCWDTFDQAVPPERILAALRHVGFRDVGRHTLLRVFSEISGTK